VRLIDLSGKRFGRWTVLARRPQPGRAVWICVCDCGREGVIYGAHLRGGFSRSYGCLQRDHLVTHGHTRGGRATRVYRCWGNMLQRCFNPNNPTFVWYGARGIGVCERWLGFQNFVADMGHPPPLRSLDRIDVDGNYEPSNCHWATVAEQYRNRRPLLKIGGHWDSGRPEITNPWASLTREF
jgi:hypothetical protein